MKRRKVIAVDLDGTLARYDGWVGLDVIGEPIAGMVDMVRGAIAAGHEVVIFTARLDEPDHTKRHRAKVVIQAWALEHIGHALDVTATKRREFSEVWDDRAVGIIPNTGHAYASTGEWSKIERDLVDAGARDVARELSAKPRRRKAP